MVLDMSDFFLKLRFTTCEVPSLHDTSEWDRAGLQAMSSPCNSEKYANGVRRGVVWLAPTWSYGTARCVCHGFSVCATDRFPDWDRKLTAVPAGP